MRTLASGAREMKTLSKMKTTLPTLAAACLCAHDAPGQIQPDGYSCPSDYAITHNNSLAITKRTLVCQLPTAMGHWYNLADDPVLSIRYSMLSCVDWSFWSSANVSNQTITIRVYRDMTPDRQVPVHRHLQRSQVNLHPGRLQSRPDQRHDCGDLSDWIHAAMPCRLDGVDRLR